MKPKSMLLISTVIWGVGGFLIFHGLDALPLWVVWTVGPLCWYLGCAFMLVAAFAAVHQHLAARSRKTELAPDAVRTVVLRFEATPEDEAPAAGAREIPPMGGFVI
ncbi:MAG: hypothetical protein ABSD88_05390 [Candidatus Korobacteraceae bacterium]|jgi:hypothetical protein